MKLSSFFRVSFATALSRVLGFLRDILIALYLGTQTYADAFFLAFRLPNMFRAIFAEGAFSASFVPIFSKKFTQKENVGPFLNNVFSFLALSTFLLVVMGECFMPTILSFIVPGFAQDHKKMEAALIFARLSFPYLCFISLASFCAAILNTLNAFFLASLAPVFLNIFMIFGLWVGVPFLKNAGLALAISVACAGIFQFLFLYWALRRYHIFPRLVVPTWNEDIKKLIFLSVPGVLAACVMQINLLVGTMIVSQQDRGISWLYYADRICQLPLALIGVAIGVVLLPDLSKRIQLADHEGIHKSQKKAWILSLALSIPAMVGLIMLGHDIIHVLFQHGAFKEADAQATAKALILYSFGLPAFVFAKVLTPSFFAREDMWTPLTFSFLSVVTNALISYLAFSHIHYLGAALGLTLSAWLNVILLFGTLAYRRLIRLDKDLLRSVAFIFFNVLVMAAILSTLRQGFLPLVAHRWLEIMRLVILVGAGLLSYGLGFLISYKTRFT